ncbi:MAG: hypothetical protein R2750_09545 [Bacteroidales bacterium]
MRSTGIKKHYSRITIYCILYMGSLFFTTTTIAQNSSTNEIEEMARQLANPLSSVTNIPFQNNFDFNIGPYSGFRYNLNVQPIFSFKLTENWNVLSRTIIPLIDQTNVVAENSSQFGLGDALQSLFLTPSKIETKLIWGLGPAISIPTATEDVLGSHTWGVGPTAILLFKDKHFTTGALLNTIWSFAGSGKNNTTLIQPFFTYISPNTPGRSYSIISENTQNWTGSSFSGDIAIVMNQIIKLKKQLIQLGLGPKVFYGNNNLNPVWGIRFNVALIYPKKPKG